MPSEQDPVQVAPNPGIIAGLEALVHHLRSHPELLESPDASIAFTFYARLRKGTAEYLRALGGPLRLEHIGAQHVVVRDFGGGVEAHVTPARDDMAEQVRTVSVRNTIPSPEITAIIQEAT